MAAKRWTCGHEALPACGECQRRLSWKAAQLQAVVNTAEEVEIGAAILARLETSPDLRRLRLQLVNLRDALMVWHTSIRREQETPAAPQELNDQATETRS